MRSWEIASIFTKIDHRKKKMQNKPWRTDRHKLLNFISPSLK